MKKLLSFTLVLALGLLTCVPQSFALFQLRKWTIQIVDEQGEPVVSQGSVWVKTADSDTDATIASDLDNTSQTQPQTPDSNGVVTWFANTTTVDVVYQNKGLEYLYSGYDNQSDRRITTDGRKSSVFNSNYGDIASASTITIPDAGSFFNVTGSTAINTINTSGHTAGRRVVLLFQGAITFGQNPTNITGCGDAGFGASTGDSVEVFYDGTSNWHCIQRT